VIDAGVPTNAQLEPDAVAKYSGASSLYSMDGRTPGYSGSTKLLQRETDSQATVWLTIQIDRTYPEAFGAHGTVETCYAVSISTGKQKSAPVTTIIPICPIDPTYLDPSATS